MVRFPGPVGKERAMFASTPQAYEEQAIGRVRDRLSHRAATRGRRLI